MVTKMKSQARKPDVESAEDELEAINAEINAIERLLNKSVRISFARNRLSYLLRFLAIDFDHIEEPQKDDEKFFLQGILSYARYQFLPKQRRVEPFLLSCERPNWRSKAKAVQRELNDDLMRIVTATPDQDHKSFVSRFFDKLKGVNRRLQQVTGLPPEPRGAPVKTIKNRRRRYWEITSGFYSKDGGALLLGGEVYHFTWGPGDSLRDNIYFHLAGTVEERCLEDLKLCQQCQKLYVRNKSNQKFCGESCKIDFNNSRRLKTDYFKINRAYKRKKAIKKARRLRKEGKPILRIVEETGLSQRILKKAGLIHHST